MKHKYKGVYKIGLLSLAILIFANCQKEDPSLDSGLEQQIQPKTHLAYEFKGSSYTELQSDTTFTGAMAKLGKVLQGSKEGKNPANNFTLDSSNVKVVEVNSKTYYTFLIHREDPEPGYFENLVVSTNGSEIKAYLLKYTPSGDEQSIHDFKGAIDVTPIEDPISITGKQLTICYRVHTVMCSQGGWCNGKTYIGTHIADASCCTNSNYLSSSYSTQCMNYTTGGGGGGGGGGGPIDPGTGDGDDGDIYTNPSADIEFREKDFVKWDLDLQQRSYYYDNNFVRSNILGFLYQNGYFTNEGKDFAAGLIEEFRQDYTVDEDAMRFVFEAYRRGNVENDLNATFLLATNMYTEIDFIANQDAIDPFSHAFMMKCMMLRVVNPEICDGLSTWECNGKIMWLASKDGIHIVLDGFGLVPVVGEVADLVNGGLYLLEGDGVNATLSFASAVPVAGWAAVGVRYAVKINEVASIGTKVKLVWKRLPDNTIYFGANSTCRKQLRKTLGLATGDARQAHHIIPLNKQGHEVVQKAARSSNAFHLNEALNGIPLENAVHYGSHANYDNLILGKLETFRLANPNATPNQCYDKVAEIITQVRTAILANPNTPLNQLSF